MKHFGKLRSMLQTLWGRSEDDCTFLARRLTAGPSTTPQEDDASGPVRISAGAISAQPGATTRRCSAAQLGIRIAEKGNDACHVILVELECEFT